MGDVRAASALCGAGVQISAEYLAVLVDTGVVLRLSVGSGRRTGDEARHWERKTYLWSTGLWDGNSIDEADGGSESEENRGRIHSSRSKWV